MQNKVSTGIYPHSDLSIQYDHRGNIQNNARSKFRLSLKDLQVMVAEFLGTFFLALYIATTKITETAGAAPYAIGFGLASAIYTFAPISGGQFNPAVTTALLLRNKLSVFEALYIYFAQFFGALMAGVLALFLYQDQWSDVGYPSVSDTSKKSQAFVAEFVQTFALATVALNTSSTKAQANNSYFGIAIGSTVLSGALIIGGISGGCFNPSISMLTLLQKDYADMWVVFLGPLLGGVASGLLFRLTNPGEFDDSDPVLRLTSSHFNPRGNKARMLAMLIQEFEGTFYLVWGVSLSVNASISSGAIAFGFLLASWVYAGGSVSGAHYNPSITLGVWLRSLGEKNYMRISDVALYMSTQLTAAFTAGAVAAYVNGGFENIASPTVNLTDHSHFEAWVIEFIFTALLVFTVLNTATLPSVTGNSYFGLAIGFVVMCGAIAVADISGGVFNPSIGIALPTLTNNGSGIWLYVTSEFCGAVFAALLFKFFQMGNTYVENNNDDYADVMSKDSLKSSLLSIGDDSAI